MKLFYSPNSPYARKCRIIILEKGLQDRVELIETSPADNSPALIAANPLGSVPTLLLGDGKSLCESPVICEFLDSLGGASFYPTGRDRFKSLALAALADGIMDAAVACVMEGRRPEGTRHMPWVERKQNAASRAIDAIAKTEFDPYAPLCIGTIGLAVALAYVDSRLPQVEWRKKHENLANWLDAMHKKPSFAATQPA